MSIIIYDHGSIYKKMIINLPQTPLLHVLNFNEFQALIRFSLIICYLN